MRRSNHIDGRMNGMPILNTIWWFCMLEIHASAECWKQCTRTAMVSGLLAKERRVVIETCGYTFIHPSVMPHIILRPSSFGWTGCSCLEMTGSSWPGYFHTLNACLEQWHCILTGYKLATVSLGRLTSDKWSHDVWWSRNVDSPYDGCHEASVKLLSDNLCPWTKISFPTRSRCPWYSGAREFTARRGFDCGNNQFTVGDLSFFHFPSCVPIGCRQPNKGKWTRSCFRPFSCLQLHPDNVSRNRRAPCACVTSDWHIIVWTMRLAYGS